MTIKVKPTAGKLLIKPDNATNYVSEVDDKGNEVFKLSKDSKIVLTESATKEKKGVGLSTGVVLEACETAGIDFPSGIRHYEYKGGERVAYFAANLSPLKYKGQNFWLLPSEFAIAIIEEK